MLSTQKYSDLLTAETCFGIVEKTFHPFGLLHFSRSKPNGSQANFKILCCGHLSIKTQDAPLQLATPEECLGGLQFAYMQRHFVYRFDNCVLSLMTGCEERLAQKFWLTTGTLYLAHSIDDARNLVKNLIQLLPSTSQQCARQGKHGVDQHDDNHQARRLSWTLFGVDIMIDVDEAGGVFVDGVKVERAEKNSVSGVTLTGAKIEVIRQDMREKELAERPAEHLSEQSVERVSK